MKDFLDLARGLVRPVVTLLVVGVLCAIVVRLVWNVRLSGTVELPAEVWAGLIVSFTTTVAVIVAWWFASRNRGTP